MNGPDDAARRLSTFRNTDGGFGLRPRQASEPEPTALAAIALDDDGARDWLRRHQRDDGSFGISIGTFADEATTGLAALALSSGAAREAALDHVESVRGRRVQTSAALPLDPAAVGWAWTGGTASWVEPTARALWALRLLRPSSEAIGAAIELLRDREALGGGWNYGNREVLGVDLPAFAQTTAIALVALRGHDPVLEDRGIQALRRLWRIDAPGPLTLAMCIAAFRMHEMWSETPAVASFLGSLLRRTDLDHDAVAWAWIALATGDKLPGLAR